MSTAADNELKALVKLIRALVTSSKQPCRLFDILRDYREMESRPFPFRQFGYSSAAELLKKTGEFKISQIGEEVLIWARENSKTAHITSMIRAQKSSKPSRIVPKTQAPRKPTRWDQSWNKSSFSAKVFPQQNRCISSNSGNKAAAADRNNNNNKDLDEMLKSKLGQEQPKMNQQKPRPILGQQCNNSNPPLSPRPSLVQGVATASASASILPQREQMLQQQQQQQQPSTRSVQDRLKLKMRVTNGNTMANGHNGSISVGNSLESSPALSSAGSELVSNPFGASVAASRPTPYETHQPQQQQQTTPIPQFNKHRYMRSPSQLASLEVQQMPTMRNDPVTALAEYCAERNYAQPEYTIFKPKFSKGYQGRVSVNGCIYSTYPLEHPNEPLAKISVAQQAIEQIMRQKRQRPQLLLCNDNDYELTEKLYNGLLTHPHGIFANKIPEWFEDTYRQALPSHWWRLVEESSKFVKDVTEFNYSQKSIIIFANTADDVVPSLTSQRSDMTPMDDITLPWGQAHWNLSITHCSSTVQVWAQLFGEDYTERFYKLTADMSQQSPKARPIAIAARHIYLVYVDEIWKRVRVEDVDKVKSTAQCFFIDFGYAESLCASMLHICEPQFLLLPAQAVCFSLYGLEDFAEHPHAQRHLEAQLMDKLVVAKILTKDSDFYATGKIQVAVSDTSDPEVDVNVNQKLLNEICDHTPPPEIKPSGVTNFLVPHVCDDGDFFVIMETEIQYVRKLIQQLIESKFKREQHMISATDLEHSNMFLVCEDGSDGASSNWYRGALADSMGFDEHAEEFNILYVDYGKTRRTHISKLFRLESLSTALSRYPRQAIKVRLHNIPAMTKGIVGRMRALLPTNCTALVRMATPGAVPLVTVYTRINDTVCNINDVIRVEQELECTSENFATDSVSVTSGLVDLTRALSITAPPVPHKMPKLKSYANIPDVNDFLEVRVVMSANPSNFVVQPYVDYSRLRSLTKELQEYCEKNDDFIPADMVEIGQAYAAKNPDGFYHRVTVVDTYSGDMIHVSYCDFGDVAILRCEQLKILPLKFRQLPKMAIHAKLYGIKSVGDYWENDDCVRFRDLTVGKKFVSVIKRISNEELKVESKILELELIDVQTDDDIYIHQLLLKEERAVSCVDAV